MAREAGPAGQSKRAGGAMAVGPAGRSSRAGRLLAREAGPARQKLQLTSLVQNCFPHLSQSKKILPVCLYFKIYLIFLGLPSILSCPQAYCMSPPPPSHRRKYGCGFFLRSPPDRALPPILILFHFLPNYAGHLLELWLQSMLD